MNTEKIQVLVEEIIVLVDTFKKAIESTQKLGDLNADSKNVGAMITRFSELEARTEIKINQINTAASVLNRQWRIQALFALLSCGLFGFAAGWLINIYSFGSYIQNTVLNNQMTALYQAREAFEKERQQLPLFKIAQENGIRFYEDVIVFPVKKDQITMAFESGSNKAAYLYADNPTKLKERVLKAVGR